MPDFGIMWTGGAEGWIVVGVIALSGVLGVLCQFATIVRNETHLHDLKVRVHNLRREQVERFRENAAKSDAYTTGPDDVLVVGEADAVAATQQRHAA